MVLAADGLPGVAPPTIWRRLPMPRRSLQANLSGDALAKYIGYCNRWKQSHCSLRFGGRGPRSRVCVRVADWCREEYGHHHTHRGEWIGLRQVDKRRRDPIRANDSGTDGWWDLAVARYEDAA